MKILGLTFLVLSVTLLLVTQAQGTDPAQGTDKTSTLSPAALTDPLLSAPAWLAGQWCGKSNQDSIEEHWMPASGSFMMGMSRTSEAMKTKSFEFMRIQPVEGQMALIAQPGGKTETIFKQTASKANWIRFENPNHDFPTRIEYRRDKNKLSAVVAGPGNGDNEVEMTLEYALCTSAETL